MSGPYTHIGLGTILAVDSTGATSFVTISQRTTIDGPEIDVESIETTTLDSTGGKTFRPSKLYDPGEISMTIYYDPQATVHTTLTTMIMGGTVGNWKLTFADGSSYTFLGFLTSFAPKGMEAESLLTADMKVKISGQITIEAGAGTI